MINKNVFDMVMGAVEEYNEYTRRKDVSKLNYEEKRGLFYTCLRRWVGFGAKGTVSLRVEDLICTFSPSGILESYCIPRTYWKGAHYWERPECTPNIVQEVKAIAATLPKLYPTKVLNEMALIVKSIK